MNKLMIAGIAGTFLAAGAAAAGEPVKLTDNQLDSVNGGAFLFGAGGAIGAFNGSFGSRSARSSQELGGGFVETQTTNFNTGGAVTSVVLRTEASGFVNSRANATSQGFFTIATNGIGAAGGVFVLDN
jgi:hypothetical protein